MAWNRLVDLHRRHVLARKRATGREVPLESALSNHSTLQLADLLLDRGHSPSAHLIRKELIQRMQQAILHLPDSQREILALRHLEGLSVAEAAAVLETTGSAVKSRHFRALSRLRELLEIDETEYPT